MHTPTRRPRRLLLAGAFLLIVLQSLHFADVLNLSQQTPFAPIPLIIRANITPLAWCAYLLFLLGLLSFLDRRSYLLRFRNRFAICWLWSIPSWCYFDWMNFYFMRDPHTGLRAWEYINLPNAFPNRLLGYLIAFGAIAPGMFLTAELLQRLGFHRLQRKSKRGGENRKSLFLPSLIFLLGLLLAPIPFLVGTPASNLAIWVSTWALLDPINLLLNRPSIIHDWQNGRFGRTLSLAAAGLLCGLLWEFWNFWSLTKWTYHLPFLGHLEAYKYFEMPLLGLIGFPAFALETWTMWQSSLLLLSPFVEAEQNFPSDLPTTTHACI